MMWAGLFIAVGLVVSDIVGLHASRQGENARNFHSKGSLKGFRERTR